MGALATTRLTVRDFLGLPEEQTRRAELVDGDVVQLGNAGSRHEKIKAVLTMALSVHTKVVSNTFPRQLVLSETMFDLSTDEARMPDISVLFDEPSRRPSPDEHYKGAPDIAIEVVSWESASDLQRKIHAYLHHGGQEVWVLYPETRELLIHSPAKVRVFTAADPVDSAALPGFCPKVSEFFD